MSILDNKISYSQLSERTRYSESYLRKLVSQKQIPFYKLNNRAVLFDIDEIDAWLQARMTHHEIV